MRLYRGTGGNINSANNGAVYYADTYNEAAGYGSVEEKNIDITSFKKYSDADLEKIIDSSDFQESEFTNHDGLIGAELFVIEQAKKRNISGVVFEIESGVFDSDCKKYIAVIK